MLFNLDCIIKLYKNTMINHLLKPRVRMVKSIEINIKSFYAGHPEKIWTTKKFFKTAEAASYNWSTAICDIWAHNNFKANLINGINHNGPFLPLRGSVEWLNRRDKLIRRSFPIFKKMLT